MKPGILDGAEWYYRMYLIYLANCEAVFRTGTVEKGHYIFYKPRIPNDGKSKIPATRPFTIYEQDIAFSALNIPNLESNDESYYGHIMVVTYISWK